LIRERPEIEGIACYGQQNEVQRIVKCTVLAFTWTASEKLSALILQWNAKGGISWQLKWFCKNWY